MTEEIELERVVCASCAMVMYIPKDFAKKRREDHSEFYCAAGHKMGWWLPKADSPEVLKAEIAKLKERIRILEAMTYCI